MLRVDCQHGVQQSTPAAPLADLAQTACPFGGGGEADLAGVLDRQHMTPRNRSGGLLGPALDQPLRCHFLVRQEAAKPLGLRSLPVTQPADAARPARNRTFEELRPLLSRRRSPNSPADHVTSIIPAPALAKGAAYWNRTFDIPRKA